MREQRVSARIAAEMANDAGRELAHSAGMDEARLIRARRIRVRRAICELIPAWARAGEVVAVG